MSDGSIETKTKLDSAGELSDIDNERTCVDCETFRTPLWRGGPAGPKSLCYACGIKSRKKRQAALGMRPAEKNKNRKSNTSNDLKLDLRMAKKKMSKDDDPKTCNSKSSTSCSRSCSKGVSKFLDLGFKFPVLKRSAVEKKRLWRKLGASHGALLWLCLCLSVSFVFLSLGNHY